MILNGTETRTIYLISIYLEQGSRLTQYVCVFVVAWERCPFTSMSIQFHTKSDFGLFFVVKIKRCFMIYRHKYIHVYVYVWLY